MSLVPRGAAGLPLVSRGFLALDWAPSAGADVALESDAAYSHQREPYLWCGTADGIKHLVLHSEWKWNEPVIKHVLQICGV